MDDSALRARYDRYDQNVDGHLQLLEFAELLNELGAGYDDAQVKSAFESLDANHDGRIDFAEFSGWWVS